MEEEVEMKPIIFNSEMVCALLEGRKTVTRRMVKPQPRAIYCDGKVYDDDGLYVVAENKNGGLEQIELPYRPGYILYIRETWTVWNGNYEYKADVDSGYGPFCSSCTLDICAGDCNRALKWRPSIHMPREAARIFLRVTNVRVEKLQEITEEQAKKEGFEREYIDADVNVSLSAKNVFADAWDNTIKPSDRSLYGWEANPWVLVIEFERCEKPEEDT